MHMKILRTNITPCVCGLTGISPLKRAEKHLEHASQLMSSEHPGDLNSALTLLDSALKLYPQWEKALELKARALLHLRRFKDVANMLRDHIPTRKFQTYAPESPINKENTKLLLNNVRENELKKRCFLKCLSIIKLKEKLIVGPSKRFEKEQWRYLVLGQACCHLGMMEDAMILLQKGKQVASAAFRQQSNCLHEDRFCSDMAIWSELDLVSHLLGSIKFLLRRRAAALAALEAGLYTESVRHFSKIIDGKRCTPQGFVAECYMHRAIAYQAAGKFADAIADCNRTLVLFPNSVDALSARASLFEMVRCFPESLHDLEQLRVLWEVQMPHKNIAEPIWRSRWDISGLRLQGGIECIDRKIVSMKHRLNSHWELDSHMLLGLPRGCSRADVERVYLLIYLKHRPDKATHFIDRCELLDDRLMEALKYEARSSALSLFCLIRKAYIGVLSTIENDRIQATERYRIMESTKESFITPIFVVTQPQISVKASFATAQDDQKSCWSDEDNWLDHAFHCHGGNELSSEQLSVSTNVLNLVEATTKAVDGTKAFGGQELYTQEEQLRRMESNVFVSPVVLCRETANASHWTSHQIGCPWQPLPVT
eukprot:c19683_g1_i4 orf=336-2129(+)